MARAAAPPKQPPVNTAMQRARVMTGRELYLACCASRLGLEGRGGGPAAEALRMRPADLTELSQKHGGQFPKVRVERLLGGMEGLPAHGGKRMPVWGPVFLPLSPSEAEAVALTGRLIQYLESIPKPARKR
jgi:hypothetical protein